MSMRSKFHRFIVSVRRLWPHSSLASLSLPTVRFSVPVAVLVTVPVAVLVTVLVTSKALAATFSVPDYPFWPNRSFEVDEAGLELKAADYCAEASAPNTLDFTYGYLPLLATDALCTSSSQEEVSTLLGDLYLSGYFGGIWLRDVLE